ncbi:hypothetical protein [Actinokineospora iranica]|uniref:hypothetical protein n=1 Tax=Actinokineospora iranica TaxID=1271860 RepID=UPI0011136C97|nr:hypothetical protein [Actinokineospora iranica]
MAELVTGLDEGLTRGDHLPSQWTAPGFDFPEPHWEEWLMVPVTDPDRTLTVIREHVRHGQPQETGRVLALLAGLDYWINCQCNHLPRDWTTE